MILRPGSNKAKAEASLNRLVLIEIAKYED